MIALLLIALAVGAIWAPQTRGKTLQQIELERYGELIDTAPRRRRYRAPDSRLDAMASDWPSALCFDPSPQAMWSC